MMKSPMMKMIGMISWVITALASINVLTAHHGYSFYSFIGNFMPALVVPLKLIVGVAGLVSFIMFIMAMKRCPKCGNCPCNCSSKAQGQQGAGM